MSNLEADGAISLTSEIRKGLCIDPILVDEENDNGDPR
jgi:hypothetical protein